MTSIGLNGVGPARMRLKNRALTMASSAALMAAFAPGMIGTAKAQ